MLALSEFPTAFLAALGVVIGCARPPPPDEGALDEAPVATDDEDAGAAAVDESERIDPLEPGLESDPVDAASPPLRVKFDWSPPCQVPVVEDIVEGGQRTRWTMTLALTQGEGELVLTVGNMRLTHVDGIDARSAPIADAASPFMQLAAIPSVLRIRRGGEFLGLKDLDAAIRRASALVAQSGDRDLQDRMPMLFLRSAKSSIAFRAHGAWNEWVELWLSTSFPPRATERTLVGFTFDHQRFPSKVVVANRGPVEGAPELALLSARGFVDGTSVVRARKQEAAEVKAAFDGGWPLGDAEVDLDGARFERIQLAAIDPRTGRPYRTRSEIHVTSRTLEIVEMHDAMFDWSAAIGCGQSQADGDVAAVSATTIAPDAAAPTGLPATDR